MNLLLNPDFEQGEYAWDWSGRYPEYRDGFFEVTGDGLSGLAGKMVMTTYVAPPTDINAWRHLSQDLYGVNAVEGDRVIPGGPLYRAIIRYMSDVDVTLRLHVHEGPSGERPRWNIRLPTSPYEWVEGELITDQPLPLDMERFVYIADPRGEGTVLLDDLVLEEYTPPPVGFALTVTGVCTDANPLPDMVLELYDNEVLRKTITISGANLVLNELNTLTETITEAGDHVVYGRMVLTNPQGSYEFTTSTQSFSIGV